MRRVSTTRRLLARAGRWLASLLAAGIVLLLGTAGALAGGRTSDGVGWEHSSFHGRVVVNQRGKLILEDLGGRAERCLTEAGVRELRRRLRAVAGLPGRIVVIDRHPGRNGGYFDRLTVSWRGQTHFFEDVNARRDLPVQARLLISLMARFVRSHRHQLWITSKGAHPTRPHPVCQERI